ncbi:MAG: ribosome small subunit-dependent GTPase [Pseudomonadota bacterium]|jgi:ribosome biogenesis GTPase
MTETARIVASHGKSYIIECAGGKRLRASTRGKKTDYACGDLVNIQIINDEQAVIERVLERQTLLYRSDAWKSKLIAANVTQLIIVLASEPSFSTELISRCAIAAEAGGIQTLICLNKCDLPSAAAAKERLEYFVNLGYKVIEVSALTNDISALRAALVGHISVLVGQSGMGKSTITNALLPDANARVNEISIALDAGKHTTTNATFYHLDAESALIDSPGLQSFGLAHITAQDLPAYFPELRERIGTCRFHNCRHRQEPDCGMRAGVEEGTISPQRLALLHRLQDELSAGERY